MEDLPRIQDTVVKVLLVGCPDSKGKVTWDKWTYRKQSHRAGSYQRKGTLSESHASPGLYSTSSTE